MRFFFLQDFQHWLLSVLLGLILAILVYLGFSAYGDASARADEKALGEFHHYPDGIEGRNYPTPTFIVFIYLGFIIWAILYVVYIGLRGAI